jgi:hypothetical protein
MRHVAQDAEDVHAHDGGFGIASSTDATIAVQPE